ncbi:NADPH:adrenodoxin oxidoreductase, mitochondrial [Paramicrosporidium saccamoebae]|uniref:NADPH:adrenodoxin oxidoreductase, mitochondrial n=1 Tax=Paramicrosporidium saccamoebae TaxID=1246581 RepID=A0A2H9TMF9_9FUNG|nr:NADPH:adrenodoxin oxidoreductase, mitochondrial [Paramicrosporidium saccamoebae]
MHDSVVIATGMTKPRLLGIPGEGLLGSFNAAQVVGWYNGDSQYKDITLNLNCVRRVAIIGHGNVALDIARIFLKTPNLLESTDISENALRALRNSKVEEIDIIGRRGPLQRPMNRLFTLLKDLSGRSPQVKNPMPSKTWSLQYFLRPQAILGRNCVESLELVKTSLSNGEVKLPEDLKRMPVHDTSQVVRIPYDMIISCLGFITDQNFGLPSKPSGAVLQDGGRVTGYPGLYVCGWASVGAVGELASTIQNARNLADGIISDFESRTLSLTKNPGELASYFSKNHIKHT